MCPVPGAAHAGSMTTTSSSPARTAVSVALRAAGLVGAYGAVTAVWDATTAGPHETDIGGGLVALGVLVLASLAWGARDGRHQDLGRLAVTWVGVGLVAGVLAAGAVLVRGGEPGEVLGAVAVLVPLLTVVVATPALVGGALTGALTGAVTGGPAHRTPGATRG